jgi:hypothetical protein
MMSENDANVKLVLSFDIRAGTQQVYYQFMIGQFVPALQGMGLQMTDAWHTVYGKYPSRITSFVGLDVAGIRKMLNSPEWKELEERLLEYVENYSWRIIPLRDGFQL